MYPLEIRFVSGICVWIPCIKETMMMMMMMMMIDVAIPGEKIRLIPIIIGASDTISKSFRKYVSDIPGNHDVKELQKTAILGTAHILRKVLM